MVRDLDNDDLRTIVDGPEYEMSRFVGAGSGHAASAEVVVELAEQELQRRQQERRRQEREQAPRTARQPSGGVSKAATVGIVAVAVGLALAGGGGGEKSSA